MRPAIMFRSLFSGRLIGASWVFSGSKASGEPPFLLSVAIVNATKNAIRASRVERGLSAEFDMDLPCSVDRVQMACGVASADMSI